MKKLVLISLISLILSFTVSCQNAENMTIERVSENELSFCFENLNENLNSKKMYSLILYKEDIIIVDMQKEEGALNFTVYDQNENEIYSGNGYLEEKFTIRVNEDGKYRIEIDGNRAKGFFKILIA